MSLCDDFFIVAITRPEEYPNEEDIITRLIDGGRVSWVHIRKPSWSLEQTARLVSSLPRHIWPRLILHDNFPLLNDFPLGGVHLNSRNPIPPPGATRVSRSIHSLEQLEDSVHYNYVTLSPIFDSISKPGYKSAFSLDEISGKIAGKRVVALGGVTPERIPLLRDTGFAGAAMLGHFFP